MQQQQSTGKEKRTVILAKQRRRKGKGQYWRWRFLQGKIPPRRERKSPQEEKRLFQPWLAVKTEGTKDRSPPGKWQSTHNEGGPISQGALITTKKTTSTRQKYANTLGGM